jgi:putative transport protein
MLDFLATQPLLLLFAVIGLGYLVGSIRVLGFSLGSAAVLFAGLFFGAIDPRLRVPDLVYILGLILFVYTVGLQSGPTFFASFGRRAFRANLFALAVVVIAALMAYVGSRWFDLEAAAVAGVYCGALTNTPALAASMESIRTALQQHGVSAETLRNALDAPVIGYSVSYPFGVIGVLGGFYLFGRLWKQLGPSATTIAESEEGKKPGSIFARTYRVVNPGIVGKPVSAAFALYQDVGFVLSRMRRGDITSLVYGETRLQLGDLVVAVGDATAHERAKAMFGADSIDQIQLENQEFDFRRIEVSDKKVVGKTISALKLQELLDATITRIRRGDVDFVPTGETILERGDRVRVITWAGNIERVIRFFGDSVRQGTEMDLLSFSLGIALGILLGLVPIPLPGGTTFSLGFAGGPLVVGLVLGRLARSGPITWTMPFAVNLSVRQVGLALFLAGIGTKAGFGFIPTIAAGGWKLMILGGLITATVTLVVLAVGSRWLHLSHPAAMGMMSGIQTQPACLAYAADQSSSNAPNIWYASVYPVSMIAKILLAQILVSRLF